MALLCYVADSFASGVGVMRIIFAAILVSNMRATWLASKWKPESAEAERPPRLNDTLGDKFTDQLPPWLWPKIRIAYYIYSFLMLTLTTAGIIIIYLRGLRVPEN